MAIIPALAALAGEWKGTNRLHLTWMPNPLRESDSTARVRPIVGEQSLEIAYTWAYEGTPHEGLLVMTGDEGGKTVRAFWTDSWHSSHVLMFCEGSAGGNGKVSLKGSYAVPDHADWGWRTDIIPSESEFQYVMYNVSPEGIEELAVETTFVRSEG
jgi:hypothetical protein